MLRDAGLGDGPVHLQRGHDVAGRLLAGREHLQDVSPGGVAERLEDAGHDSGVVYAAYAVSAAVVAASGVVAVGDRGVAPAVGGQAEELLALGHEVQTRGDLGVDGFTGLDVHAQAEQGHVPAEPDGARSVERPHVRVDRRLVDELERRAVGTFRQRHRQPRHHPAELPRHGERPRLVAGLDRAAGVAHDLVRAALGQLARHRQEPARDPLRVGQAVPQVRAVGGVRASGHGDPGRRAVALAGADLPGDQPGSGDGVDDGHVSPFHK